MKNYFSFFLSILFCLFSFDFASAYSIPINENFVYKGRSNFGFVSNYIGTNSNHATLRAIKTDSTMSASSGTYILAEFTVDSSTQGYASWNAITLDNFYLRGENNSVPFSSEFLYFSVDSQGPSATYYAILYISSGSGSFNNVYFTGEVRFDSVTAVQDSVKLTAFSYSGDNPDFSSIISKLNSIDSSLDNIESDVGDIASILNNRFPSGDITLQNGQYVCTDDGTGDFNENCGYATLPTDLYNRWHSLENLLVGLGSSVESLELTTESSGQAQAEATDRQTEQQQTQYEQEKAEESRREESLDDSYSGLDVDFGINSIFVSSLESSCSVDISTIASWIHSPVTTYHCWFPMGIRNGLTVIITIFVNIIITSFVIRWLSSGESAGIPLSQKEGK